MEEENNLIGCKKLVESTKKGEKSLEGKLCFDQLISKDVIRSTMARILKACKPFSFQDISQNLFVIKF